MQAGFIGDPFSWKRTAWRRGGRGERHRQSRVRVVKASVAKGWDGLRLGGQGAERESFALRTYVVAGMR